MKNLKHLIPIVALICFVLSSAIVPNAAQQGASPRIGGNISAEPSTSAATPLKQPLTLNMSGSNFLCNNLLQRIESLKQLAHTELQTMLSQQGDTPISWPGIGELYYFPSPTYKSCVEGCCSPAKSFSVQDQQAAGCANSDTVIQCIDKLIRHCISKAEKKDEIKTKLQKTQEKSNNISIKTKQLSEEIKYLLSIMP
jgi:predicted ATPase